MAKHKEPTSTPKQAILAPTQREEIFRAEYANNIRLEPTVYDLKVIFGETDLSSGAEIVKQHTAITIPWALVKVGLYLLEVNLEVHEFLNGKVIVPPSQIPAPSGPIPPEHQNDPNAPKVREIAEKIRQEFLKTL